MNKNKQDEHFNRLYSRCSSLMELAKRLQSSGEGLEYDLRELRQELRESKENSGDWRNSSSDVSLMFLVFRAEKILKAAKTIKKNVGVVQETYNQAEGLDDEKD